MSSKFTFSNGQVDHRLLIATGFATMIGLQRLVPVLDPFDNISTRTSHVHHVI